MSGISQFNFPAFDRAAEELRARGYEVVSPAELDSPKHRAAFLKSEDGDLETAYGAKRGDTWADLLARDIRIVADHVDAVAVLPGWTKSRGARLETFVAHLTDKPILHYPSLRRVSSRVLASAWVGWLGMSE